LIVGFIGAGKVGYSIGKYLSLKKINISGYYSRNYENAKDAALFTNSNSYTTLKELISDSQLIFITTCDDAISEVWQKIKTCDISGKYICHTSGSHASDVFGDIEKFGAYGFSIHPIYPFSSKYHSYEGLENVYLSIEGDKRKIGEIKEFFDRIGNKNFILESNKKVLYHLASVATSNLVLSLLDIGCKFLIESGLEEKEPFEVLMPLIKNNINNIKEKGIVNAVTGPIERGDLETVRKHLKKMPSEFIEVYKSLSLNLALLSSKKNPDKSYDSIVDELKKEIGDKTYENHNG
jgi:predicted short-subunit dehydrogenase-like oxidoreductase (DUF2520 family)